MGDFSSSERWERCGRILTKILASNVWGLLVLKGFNQSKLRSFPILINSAFTSWHVGARPPPLGTAKADGAVQKNTGRTSQGFFVITRVPSTR